MSKIELQNLTKRYRRVPVVNEVSFSINSGDEFDKALANLQAQGITSLIFDVRQNGGGSTDALAHILSHFSHQGPHAITIDEDGNREEQNPDPAVPLLGLPWVVLCNNSSASSSEVTAAFAKDRARTVLLFDTAGRVPCCGSVACLGLTGWSISGWGRRCSPRSAAGYRRRS